MQADISLKRRAYILLPFMIFFGILKLFKVVKKEKIDLISVHWILPNGVMALAVSKLTGVPYTITLPGTDAYLAYRYKVFGLVAKLIAVNSNAIFSNSSLHLNRILDLGVKNKVTAVICYPIDVSKFKPSNSGVLRLRKRHGLTGKSFVILCVGRLVYKKGFSYLIKSLKKVSRNHPFVKLLIAGEGDLKNELINLTKRLKIERFVEFVGTVSRDEMQFYYNLSHVVVAPSIIDKSGNVDGGPVVSYESMACSKPQIATNVLGVADILVNGVNGFVVPQKNSEALTKSLEILIKSKKLRETMGTKNRILITKQASMRNVGTLYTKYFNQVVGL